tara:strand:+ start:4006 stop:4140 length:135 start_codon:yes stop_codon:yes gene_type:complete
MPYPMKKKKDWFDTHVTVIGLDEKTNKLVKEKIKAKFHVETKQS